MENVSEVSAVLPTDEENFNFILDTFKLFNITLKDEQGNYKNVYTILGELANAWNKLGN